MNCSPFGSLPGGEVIESYSLTSECGLQMKVMPYGATITSLLVPDRSGDFADVVLGFDQLEGYLGPHPYFGAVVGRVAGRIGGARFTLDGRLHDLDANDGPNHLHGGKGFDRRLWTAIPVARADATDSLRLSYRSPDGEEGYPGTLDVAVTYTVTDDNRVIMETEAVCDRATPVSLTQHSYFNLAGERAGCIREHVLQICADEYAPTDSAMTLLGRREPVVGSANDFNQPRRIGEALSNLFESHGDLYFLPRTLEPGIPRFAARVFEPISGRVLTISTTESCLQFYTGVALDGTLTGKSGRTYGPHAGFCLECEGYPNGANSPDLGDIILRPGQRLRQTTIYAFSTD